jgi:hypothetical protein
MLVMAATHPTMRRHVCCLARDSKASNSTVLLRMYLEQQCNLIPAWHNDEKQWKHLEQDMFAHDQARAVVMLKPCVARAGTPQATLPCTRM